MARNQSQPRRPSSLSLSAVSLSLSLLTRSCSSRNFSVSPATCFASNATFCANSARPGVRFLFHPLSRVSSWHSRILRGRKSIILLLAVDVNLSRCFVAPLGSPAKLIAKFPCETIEVNRKAFRLLCRSLNLFSPPRQSFLSASLLHAITDPHSPRLAR